MLSRTGTVMPKVGGPAADLAPATGGGTGAPLAQERRRDEVDGALAPARPLHAQDAGAILDEVGDRLELVLAERRVRVAGEPVEVVLR